MIGLDGPSVFARGPLLTAQEGASGTFVHFLREIGLENFLKEYPLAQLVEWGWLIPSRRVVFPLEYFESWPTFPSFGERTTEKYGEYDLLWDSSWFIEDDSTHLWFLHPAFHPIDTTEQLLESNVSAMSLPPVPDEIHHSNGCTIKPYVDYFFNWQAYALIDVIRTADCIAPILNTPDIESRAQGIVRIASLVKELKPTDVLHHTKRWGGFASLMTQLSHYRAFRDALRKIGDDNDDRDELRRKGARLLAEHFGITAASLGSAIKNDLLRLAQDWRWAFGRQNALAENAWPFLQTDIRIAMEWLCVLSGNKLDHYLEAWQYAHRGQEAWAELHTVLPYEFFEDRDKFIQMAPIYLKKFPNASDTRKLVYEPNLKKLVDTIRQTNYSFINLLGAFRQMHEELSYAPDKKGGLDFREHRPLDSYAVVAFRAETCLRERLEHVGQLESIPAKKRTLEGYILNLSKRSGLSERALDFFDKHTRLAQLHDAPPDAIDRIRSIETNLEDCEHELVQALLATCLARNYFVHHRYLDHELLRSDNSAFVLGGIVMAVLYLLA